MDGICLVEKCKNPSSIKNMCYKHGILRYKLTKYYHKIGDPLLIESYKNIQNDDQIYVFTKVQIENYIKKLRFIWSGWNKCLLARKELTKLCFENLDYGHNYFVNSVIIPNMSIIEKKLELCYLLISKYNNINNNIGTSNIENIINDNIKKNKKKKSKRKIDNNFLKENDDNEILNKTINLNIKLLSKIELYINIKMNINKTNSFMKHLFTDNTYNNDKYILNNASYCVFIKDIFLQYNLKYIKMSYNIKSKDLKFVCDCFLEEKEIIEEISRFNNFNDGLFEWYNKIINILINIKKNTIKLYNTYIKHKTLNNESYFQNIDEFIENQYKPLCIHINNGNIENICLENRHNRVLKKEDLNIIEIFNKLEISISTIYIPQNIQECLCFWILNEIQTIKNEDSKKIIKENIKLIKGWFCCCVDNDIFSLSGNIPIDELIIYNMEKSKNIIILGCYLYFLKYTENNINEIKYINEIKNNIIDIYLIDDNKPKIVFNKKDINNSINIYYIYK